MYKNEMDTANSVEDTEPAWLIPPQTDGQVDRRKDGPIETCMPPSIGLYNGLIPNKWQAIIETNDSLGYWWVYALFSLDE